MKTSILNGHALRSWIVAAVLPVLLLLYPQLTAASDASTERADTRSLRPSTTLRTGSGQAPVRPYARAGGGVYFLNMSESSPFIRTNGREEAVGFLDHYDAGFQAGPLVSLTVGSEYNAFGKNLFTELNGFLTFYESTDVNEYSEDSAPWNDIRATFDRHCANLGLGSECIATEQEYLLNLLKENPDIRSVGWIGRIDGGAIPIGAPNFAWGDPMRIRTQREVVFHGIDLVTGTFFKQTGQTKASLFIGPSYKRLSQESETFAYESNRDPDINTLTLQEDLEAWYYGGVIGTRIDLPFKKRWNFTFDGKLGVYYLDAEYNGSQRTQLLSALPTIIDESTDWSTSDSAVATTLNVQTALSVTCLERVTFQLGTGFEYLSHAPKMSYGSVGESFTKDVSHTPARIDYSDALGVFSTFSIVLKM